jgi:ketosteroid isomerase-like protein
MHQEAARIELVHSTWINYERAGDLNHLLALCADDIEFWPPNAPPIIGREEVARYLNHPETVIHDIRVSDLQIRVSRSFAYLTAKYQTTFTAQDGRTASTEGSHLWILRNYANEWIVALVAWSVWAS